MENVEVTANSQRTTSLAGGGTATEKAVAKIWAEVLRLPVVSTTDDFFNLGGDSMKAMEVIAQVNQMLGVELPLMAFFEEPTINHLVDVLEELIPKGSASEQALTEIWRTILRVDTIDPTADFFDIGGDSMKAMEVIAQIHAVLHVELPLMSFFEEPTIAHLAAVLDRLTATEPPAASQTIVKVPGRKEFPLSYSQQVFWLLEQQNNNSGLYNTARVLFLHGNVDATILERALNEVRRRHEIFQVRFVLRDDGPKQVVDPGPPLTLAVDDVSPLEAAARDAAAHKLTRKTVRDPLNLETGPPLRARLIRVSATESILAMAIHHVVSDGYTGSILLDELRSIYDAFAEGLPSQLPEVEVHFTDYAAWQRETLTPARLEEDLNYWRLALAGAPTSVDLPADHDVPSAKDREGHLRSITLPTESLHKLQVLAQTHGATLFTVLNAAFRATIYRFSGQSDFVIGTISSNRSRARTERMVGCFVNSLPLRNPILEGQTALDLISREKTVVMNAFAHQDCPFAKIVEAVNPERSASDNPLFNVALLYQSYPAIGVQGAHWSADDANFDAEVGLIDLRFIAFENKVGLQIDCEFRSAVFEIATVDKLLAAYTEVLVQIAATPTMLVAEIALPQELADRAAEHARTRHRQALTITANFTADPIVEPLAFWMDELRVPTRIELAPFDQIFQQLLDPSSLLARNTDGFNLLFIQWREGHPEGSQAHELATALKSAAARGGAPIIVCICPPTASTEEQILATEVAGLTGVQVLYPREISSLYPVENYRDEYAEAIGAIPYTPDFFVALASMVARRIYALRSTPYKAIVLDCDNTLWRGVCGEEGPLGVEVDAPRRALQQFMLAQRDAGMLLCLNSKNVEVDVASVFEQNPGMLLRPEHITASRINWQSKSENLRDLARELNLGVDSIIFVDDNPLECAEVRANCPGALVLELPAEPAKIPEVLHQLWAFDHWAVTNEDRQRSELYRQGQQREQARSATGDLDEFLRSLKLEIDIRPMQAEDLVRVSQLTHRTNQFNCTTIRRSDAEIAALLDAGSECLIVSVQDRFGDYGLVGVAIFSAQPNALAVDTLLMSCRALGRRVEHHILAHLGRIAQSRDLDRVDIAFVPSAKNLPAQDFLESLESTTGDTTYSFTTVQAIAAPDAKAIPVEQPGPPVPPGTDQAPRAHLARIAVDLGDVKSIAQSIRLRARNSAVETGSTKARTAIQEIVGDIWSALLHTPAPGIHDDFFRLGGNSLLAVQVISRIRLTLGIEMPLRAMFEFPTLAAFAQQIEATRRLEAGSVTPPLVKVARTNSVPASFAQQRLWFLDQLEPENPIYNIPQMTRLRGPLSIDALQRAITEIVRRHEALRTTFVASDGQPIQVIGLAKEVPLPCTDLSQLGADERDAEVQRLALAEAGRPFNLASGTVFRAQLLRTAPEDHILLVVIHHIVGDRWSAGILAEEMEALYGAYVLGEPSPLLEPIIQYSDFSIWQRNWLQGSELDRQAAYWKRQLAGAPALLELPTDHPRPALLGHKGAIQAALLSKDLVDKLTALSQADGVTLFMTLLAALQTLMSRYSGQDDIVVGSPIAGRNTAEVEQLIGFFVNTLALRSDLSGNPTFRDLLVRVKTSTLDAYSHQDIPFERLVEELQPERSLSYQPIFQVVFALQNAPQRSLELAGLHLQRLPLHQGTSAFDMSWFATHVAAGMEIRVEYNTDLFEPATIIRAIGHFQTLLEAIVENPAQRIGQLAILPHDEQEQVNLLSSGPHLEYPAARSLQQLFEAQVARSPDAVACIVGSSHLTYSELNARANRVAHHLIKHGAGPEVLVGIFCSRNVDLLVGILGILKSGSAYVPLDPIYPKERIGYILEDAKAPIVLTQTALADQLPDFAGQRLCLDDQQDQIALEPNTNPGVEVAPHNLAYVLFTSGSTGRPKGVAIEHRNATTFVAWAQTVFTPQDLSGVLLSTSVCFDLSVFEIFVTLAAGGKIIVAENALYLPELEAKDEVTLINTVPSAIAELTRSGNVPSTVRIVNLAGEALHDDLVEQIYATTNVERVYNLYGPTEDTTYSTYTLVRRGTEVTIGRPIANSRAYILDANRTTVPLGVPGELYLTGDGLARGYYGQPTMTAQRFLPDPFSDVPDARLYRTGDLCRWLPDGNIQYMGRADHQVKVRGFRIELGEIESTLASHPAIRDTVVIAREDEPGHKFLVGYVVARQGETLSAAELRAYLLNSLPEYMAPRVFVMLEALPLTPNGKIDRKALPVPDAFVEQAEFVAPRTTTERTLAAIWSEVLHIDAIGVTSNFFTLGGHSLLAAQVISRIRRAFETELPLRDLFEAPTIEGLAKRIDATEQLETATQIPRISRDQPLPLSFAQQRMWFSDQLDPENAQFNIPSASRVDATIDLEILARTVAALVHRHETLRTNFSTVDGLPVQTIASTRQVPIQVEDLRHIAREQREAEAQKLVENAARRPFDLARDRLLRVLVIQLADDASILFLSIHHIISDRWSVTILLNELSVLYTAFSHGEPSPLPQLPVQYADFAAWQRGAAEGAQFQQQLRYWTTQLKDAPPVIELPTDRPRPAFASVAGDVAKIALSADLTARLNALSLNQGATLYMTLLAAFEVLLARYSGLEDFVIGMPIASRSHTEIEGLIGLFANTLPLRADLSGDPNFKQVLSRTKDLALGAYANQDIPLERLVEELRPERSLSYDPLVQVHFILQNAPLENKTPRGLHLKHLETNTQTAKGDLFFSLTERDGALHGRLEYNTDLFDGSTIERMLTHYRQLLDAAVANPTLPISRLPLMTSAEQAQLRTEWNTTTRAYPRHLSLPQLFEQQVGRSPDAPACVAGDTALSYSELNARANQLAHFLIAREIGPGTLIGICLNRTESILVALLGILKTGAAYLPLDPTYPQERLAYILEDAQAKLVITEEAVQGFLPDFNGDTLTLESYSATIAQHSADNPAPVADPEDLAYVLHTSGSTGKPKGVEITHRNLVNFLFSMQQEPGLAPSDTLLAVTTLSFDIAGLELYLPLITGACVAICARPDASSPTALMDLMNRRCVTVMQATPATWLMLFEAGWRGNPNLKVLCGGESLPQELAGKLVSSCRELWNMYGPTETTIWSSVARIDATNIAQITIGHPIANTTMYVLDLHRQLVPLGVAGELYIGGEGVGRGYWNKPELTAERFVADPFSAGNRMYRTGDVAKLLANGTIQCLGRIDQQVKIRGYRIELGEIESVIGSDAAVQNCVVVARDDHGTGKRLVAYVVPTGASSVDIPSLRSHLKEKLPDYMVPSAWVELRQLPLTPNGKVDRKQLPAPDPVQRDASATLEQLLSPTQEILSAIWSEVLNVGEVGLDDDFFELGGHSLLATQVISRARQSFGVDLQVRALFESPTIATLSETIERMMRNTSGLVAPPIVKVSRDQHLPLSFAQQRLWVQDQMEPDNPLFNMPRALRLKGALNIPTLNAALNGIVARHEVLRTVYGADRDGHPFQIIKPELIVPLRVIDLRDLSPTDREKEARRLVQQEVATPFKLATDSITRNLLLQMGVDDHLLVMNTHHIVSDGWSTGIILRELSALYESALHDRPSSLPDLPIQYADFAIWQRNWLQGEVLSQQVSYWKSRLEGAPPLLALPTDHPRPAKSANRGATYRALLPATLTAAVRTLGRQRGASTFMLLLAAFECMILHFTGNPDVVLGTDLANRTNHQTEDLIGFFVNLLVLRTDLSGDPAFEDLLARVREVALEAYAHQDVPFDKLVEELKPERNSSYHPLVQVLFVQQNTPRNTSPMPGIETTLYAIEMPSKFDMAVFVAETDKGISANWIYDPDLFDSSTITRMANLFQLVLETVTADPTLNISSLTQTLAQADQQQRLTQNKEFQEISLQKLKAFKRRAITIG